ncbi:MAG TPA: S-layer homology domain-containing protein [Pyrinomonadaceae bacterium]
MGPLLTVNDLGLKLYDGGGALAATVNALNLPGITGRVESAQVYTPAPGAWRASVFHTLGLLGTSQPYTGTLRVARIEYAPLRDLDSLGDRERAEMRQSIRSFLMLPFGEYFFPHMAATRAELAATLVRAGRVPQYLPGQSSYTDVGGAELLGFVESAQAAPSGPLFPDAHAGGTFRPDEAADRLTAAIALVRAAGLGAEAESYTGPLPDIADLNLIPSESRGYVAVALARGLLDADADQHFRPHDPLTRAQLAHAVAVVLEIASE